MKQKKTRISTLTLDSFDNIHKYTVLDNNIHQSPGDDQVNIFKQTNLLCKIICKYLSVEMYVCLKKNQYSFLTVMHDELTCCCNCLALSDKPALGPLVFSSRRSASVLRSIPVTRTVKVTANILLLDMTATWLHVISYVSCSPHIHCFIHGEDRIYVKSYMIKILTQILGDAPLERITFTLYLQL